MRCLNCNAEMVNYDVTTRKAELSYDVCEKCGSLWLDAGELDKMAFQVTGSIEFCSEEEDKAVQTIKGAKREGATDKKCPADGATLDLYTLSHIKFEGCPKCHGMWLDKDELRKLKNKVNDGQLHWLNREVDNIEKTSAIMSSRPCPKCSSSKLRSVIFGHSNVVIDWCPTCHGIWLDRSEFDFIVEYLRDEATKATPKEIAHE